MLEHIRYPNTLDSAQNVKNNTSIHDSLSHKSKQKEDFICNKYLVIANEIFNFDFRTMSYTDMDNLKKSKFEDLLKSIFEVLKDDSIVYLLDNINILTFEEANLIYKIVKLIIIFSNFNKFEKIEHIQFSKNINNYFQIHLNKLVQILLNNLIPSNKDYVIIVVCKLFRKLFLIDSIVLQILTKDFFNLIYSLTKTERFILSQECFKILFHIVENTKINKELVSQFFSDNALFICSEINAGINYSGLTKQNKQQECLLDDFYFMKRQTLNLIEKILINPAYEKFTFFFVNNTDNLKTVMRQLNNKCEKIVCQAVDIIYFFFLDIEIKERNIKLILHCNKENFYKFFEKNDEIFSQNFEMAEKKSFILYELERLENYLD